MSCLPNPPPPQHLFFHMPLPQNIWLFYSVNCADTFYPDHFCWRLPLFNHIIPRVMWYCSFSQWSQINWSSFTPTRLCLYFTNTSLLCKCFFPPCLCFAFAIAPLWAVFFILAILVVFTWSSCCLSIYRTQLPCPCPLYFIHSCVSIDILHHQTF